MVARLGHMRLGATRLDYYRPTFIITINGTNRKANTRLSGISIRDYLDGTPNTATLRVSGFTPTKGHEIKMSLGQADTAHHIFAGHILTTTQVYEGIQSAVAWDLECISYEYLLKRRTVSKRYTNSSASTIAADLIASYTSGFTDKNVVSGLATIDEITFTNEEVPTCLDRLAKRIGSYWYIDYGKDLHFFLTEAEKAHTIEDADVHGARGVAVSTDLSQVATRVLVEAGGSNTSADVAVGQTTIPVDDSSWYNASGGVVVAGPQRITYTGKSTIDGTGSKVNGKANLEPGAPTVAVASGTAGNITTGAYTHQVSLVIEGGETAGGTVSSSATISNVSAPGSGMAGAGTTGGSLVDNGDYYYWTTFVTAAGETTPSPSVNVVLGAGNTKVNLSSIPTSADGRVTARRIYRISVTAGDSSHISNAKLVTTINDNSTTTYADTLADGSLGAVAPSANTSGNGQIELTNVPAGPSGTTARKVYRSGPGDGNQRFVGTVSGNITTTFTDNVRNDSRGAEVLSSITRTAPAQVSDTSLPVQECSAFSASGGWVLAAGQLIRYTGRSASSGVGTLTGVPSSGIGSITASIAYNTAVVNVPHLTGVTGVLYAINKGEPVNLLVTRNDTAAQTAMAASVGGDGIHEAYFQDRRLSETEANARGDAHLTLAKDPLVTVTYQTRDQTTRAGRTVTFNLGAPTSLTGTFKIQSVTISDFDLLGVKFPMRAVQVSSRRFSLESILRLIKAA
jgi:hypothetical protein